MLTQDVGVDPEGDRRVRVSEAVGDHMDRHAGQQEVRGMNVPKVVESCHREGRDIRRESGVVRPLGLTPPGLRMFRGPEAGHRHTPHSVQDGSYSRGIQSFT